MASTEPVDTTPMAQPSQCSFCQAPGSLKICGRCRIAAYCNQDCQAAHWKTHRKVCRVTAVDASYGDLSHEHVVPREAATPSRLVPEQGEDDSFVAWLTAWHESVGRWALHGANLGFKSDDFLAKTTFFVFLLRPRQPYSTSTEALFQVERMGWLPDDELHRLTLALADPNLGPKMVEQHRSIPSGRNVVRMVIASVLAWTSTTYDLDAVVGGKYNWRNQAQLGRAMNAHFKAQFRNAIRMGDVTMDVRLLQEEWHEAMLAMGQRYAHVPFVLFGRD